MNELMTEKKGNRTDERANTDNNNNKMSPRVSSIRYSARRFWTKCTVMVAKWRELMIRCKLSGKTINFKRISFGLNVRLIADVCDIREHWAFPFTRLCRYLIFEYKAFNTQRTQSHLFNCLM